MTFPESNRDIWNKYIIYVIGLATITESIILIIVFNIILNDVYTARASYNSSSDTLPEYYNGAATVAILGLTAYSIRLFFGIFLVMGHIFESLKIILVFLVYMAVGMVINIAIGVMAHVNEVTSGYARVCYGVLGLHIFFILIAWNVLKVESQKRANAANELRHTDHVPYGAAVQTTVGSNTQCDVSLTSNRAEPVQLYPVAFVDRMRNETTGYSYPSPPKYSEVTGYDKKSNSQ